MIKQLSLTMATFAMGAAALVPVAPAMAQSRGYYGSRGNGYDRGYDDRRYNDDRAYRGENRRGYRTSRCNDGDGGTLIGAIAGGLLGHTVAGRGDHVLGTVLGAGAGALAGRAIDRSDRPGYCRR